MRNQKQKERNNRESLIQIKQKLFMRCVIFCIVRNIMQKIVAKAPWNENSTEYAETAVQEISKVTGITACSIYCRAAFKCNVQLYSSMLTFEKIMQEKETADNILAKLRDSDKITEEEKAYGQAIDTELENDSANK